MTTTYDILMSGFPGRTGRGFLGWSTIVLLQTQEGYALFDTGGAGDRPGLLNALADRGIAPADIGTVILSHLHFDHIANSECFPEADFILHESEFAYFKKHGANDAAAPRFLAQSLLSLPNVSLVDGEPEVLSGVQMICTPGHTGGHVSLVMSIDGKRVVLAQDAIKHRGEIGMNNVPGAFDPIAATASIRRIVEMADVIVPGHDAPLEILDGRPRPLAACRETVIVNVDGRSYPMEVCGSTEDETRVGMSQ